MKIAVIGAGYVGFANALVLAQLHEVTVVDTNQDKVERIRRGEPAIHEPDLQAFMDTRSLSLTATTDLA